MKVVYNKAVFQDCIPSNSNQNIQGIIEEPEIHVIALSSSSPEDQAALISDRKECLKELTLKLTTQDGIEIKDYSSFSGTSQQPSLSVVHNKEAIINVGHVDAMQT